jgi:hypothetical protein
MQRLQTDRPVPASPPVSREASHYADPRFEPRFDPRHRDFRDEGVRPPEPPYREEPKGFLGGFFSWLNKPVIDVKFKEKDRNRD